MLLHIRQTLQTPCPDSKVRNKFIREGQALPCTTTTTMSTLSTTMSTFSTTINAIKVLRAVRVTSIMVVSRIKAFAVRTIGAGNVFTRL